MKIRYNITKYKYICKYIDNILSKYDIDCSVDIINNHKNYVEFYNNGKKCMYLDLKQMMELHHDKDHHRKWRKYLPNMSMRKFIKFVVLHEIGHLVLTKNVKNIFGVTDSKEKKVDKWALKRV